MRSNLLLHMVKKLQYLALLWLMTLFFSSFIPQGAGASKIRTIVIDAGHGGKDPGCQGAIHREKDVALSVALKLGKFIEQNLPDVKVIYTRTTDVFVELEERAMIANRAKADLFISIHCNAAGKVVMIKDPKTGKKRPKMRKNKKGKMVPVETTNPAPFGSETYVMGLKNEEGKMKVAARENAAMLLEDNYESTYSGFDPESEESYIIMSNYTSAYVVQSANLALKIQQEYGKKAGRIDKGVHRQSIWVLWRTSMPSILTELGYLTNPLEETFLGSEVGQEYLAKCLFSAVRKYRDEMDGVKKEYNDGFENMTPLENENLKAGNSPVTKKDEDEDTPEASTAPAEATPDNVINKQDKEPETVAPPSTEQPNTDSSSIVSNKNNDSPADTAVSASSIANAFKKEKNQTTAKSTTLAPKPTPKKTNPPEEPKQKLSVVPANTSAEGVVFKVQFASSETPIDLTQEKFAGVKDAAFYKVGAMLKYTSGKFTTAKEAVEHQNELRSKGLKDCFVVAFKNGERISIQEAKAALGQ